MPSVLLILLFLPLIVLFLRRKSEWKLPPGPSPLPIIGNLHQLGRLSHHTLRRLSNRYGPLMYLKLGTKPAIVVSSSKLALDVLKTQDADFCNRPVSPSFRKLSYNLLNLTFTPFGEYYREMRKVFNNELLSLKRVQSLGLVREEEVARMISSISLSALSSAPADLTNLMLTYTSTIISRAAFGKSYRRTEELANFLGVLRRIQAASMAFFFESYIPYLGWLDVVSGERDRLEKTFRESDAFLEQLIEDHLDPEMVKQEREGMLDRLLRMEKGLQLTRDHIKAQLMDIIVAGTDTGSATLVWAMTELIKTPKVMEKAQNEIRRIVGDKGKVEEHDLQQLEYLRSVVKETLRLHPPAPLLVPRETNQHCRLNGYDIAPNTLVLVNAFAIGREEESWEHPEEFRPERFLDGSIDFRGRDFQLIPFGAGRRSCPGMNFGVAVVELALANLLYCFDWKLPPGMNKEDVDMSEFPGITVHKKSPLLLVPIIYKNVRNGKAGE